MKIAVISGKGGTGKSSVSAAFASIGKSVVLADCDVDTPDLHLLFDPSCDEESVFVSGQKAVVDGNKCDGCGKCAAYCRFGAISVSGGKAAISKITCEGCRLCSRVCPRDAIRFEEQNGSRIYAGRFRYGEMVYGKLAPGEENSGRLVDLVREKAGQLAEEAGISTVIIDGPPGIGCPVMSSITGTDRVAIVTEPTLSGLRDLERVAGVAKGMGSDARVIVNKYDINGEMASRIERYCRENGIPVVGRIPFDPVVVEAMVACRSVPEYAPAAAASRAMELAYEGMDPV
ncbi:MAG: ATP-binding protein [Bacteroidales bacterium]|jgi:MinD superfamily P-loop ATPase|nr:ATP-binding protein [Bacteroidales bacterium]MCI2122071.1 ATP-binding protein [Bacteroidales bacterium]MCI2146310.1 ATP-binding protein [Bacteroidales bacterium]